MTWAEDSYGRMPELPQGSTGQAVRTLKYNPGQEMSYQQGQERRKYKRYPADLTARFKPLPEDAGDPLEGIVMKISRGGLFVRTEQPFRPGSELHLVVRIITPFGEEQDLEADAKVMWVNESGPDSGMGLSFTKIDRHTQYAMLACTYRGKT